MGALEAFLTQGVFAFILTFVRIGTAVMIMPGLGDSFVPERIRLHLAIGLTFVLFPLTLPLMPTNIPGTFILMMLILTEFMIGILFGTVARILMMALDTAGMVISSSSGLASAQLFNPTLATQGSLVGAFLSVTGVLMLFVTDLHHMLITGLVKSYELFPLGRMPQAGDMADLIARAVSKSFEIGVLISGPFIILTMLIYVGMGVLSRLMPQIQVFLIAIPIQILLSLAVLSMTLSSIYLFWTTQFEQGLLFFFSNAPGVVN